MDVYLSIGTNLGDKEANIRTCVRLLEEKVGRVVCCSSLFRSAPVGFESKNDFVNAAIHVQTELSPLDLLAATEGIEREMGRMQKSEWQVTDGEKHLKHFDRIIDIDILYYEDLSTTFCDNSGKEILILPHPRMHERDFVMVPLNEIFAGKDA